MKEKSEEIDLYVVRGQGQSLLGGEMAMKLGIIVFNVNSIQIDETVCRNSDGIGKIKDVIVQVQIAWSQRNACSTTATTNSETTDNDIIEMAIAT